MQVVVIPIADRLKAAAAEFAAEVKAAGGRVEVYDQNEPVKVKIAKAQSQKIPYMIVMGDKEIEGGKVSVRERSQGDQALGIARSSSRSFATPRCRPRVSPTYRRKEARALLKRAAPSPFA